MISIQVALALIIRRDEILLARRRKGDQFEDLWEFPGGKRRPEETIEACLHREVREELDVAVRIMASLEPIWHDYPRLRVCLHPFVTVLDAGEPRPLASAELRWVPLGQLSHYAFPQANARFLALLPQVLQTLQF